MRHPSPISAPTTVIVGRYRAAAVELPADAQAAVAIGQAARAAITADPAADLRADLSAGKIDAKNVGEHLRQAALDQAVRDGMQAIYNGMQATLDQQQARAFAADRDRVTDLLRPRFDMAAAVIVDALPFMDADAFLDPVAVLARGPEAAGRYHEVAAALGELQDIAALCDTVGCSDIASYIAGPVTLAAFGKADRIVDKGTSKRERWLRLYALDGITPALNTPADAQEILDDIARQTQQAAAADIVDKRAARLQRI